MTDDAWHSPTPAELDLAQQWLLAWRARTGDTAQLDPHAKTRSSCECGTCPSFALRPLSIDESLDPGSPLPLEGHATSRDGGSDAGLLVWANDGSVDFEIYPYDDSAVALEQLDFTFPDA